MAKFEKILIHTVLIAAIAFILIGMTMQFAPEILTGFDSIRTDPSTGNYTALDTVVQFGPTMVILGFIIAVGVIGFMGFSTLFKED